MRTDTESLWVLALSSKCNDFTSVWFVFVGGCLVWLLLLTLIHWAYPGGPAWGKYKLRRAFNLDYFIMMMMMRNPIPTPSGPRGFPVIGSMNLMDGLAHHRIAAVAEACGAKRLMAFSLGQTRVVVTCNPDVAKETLNGWVFVDRPLKESAYALMFNRAIGFAPYGIYWRTLRRIAATHLFCPKQIKASHPQRFEIVHQMVAMFCTAGRGGGGDITVRDVLKRASLNNMMCSVFGRKYPLDSYNPEAHELRTLVDQGYQLLGTLNWSDHLPWLGEYFDPQKVRFRCSELVPRVNRFVSRIIADHRSAQPDQLNPDFVHVLLSLQGPDKLSDSDMIAVLWEMIFRGTDTVAVLIEWILARMVLHPDVQSRAHDELDRVVGRSRAVTEADIAEMVYLRAVVKEVLRLHPPGPLLSWSRLAIADTTVDGHHVPAGTTAMVNMWAIMRDPHVWSDPLEFKPERFVAEPDDGLEFSVLGSDHRLAPFGSGTRTCPGKTLGLTTVTFWMASLLHEFEWWPSDQNFVDFSEVLRLSCEMANPLAVKVRRRRIQSLFSTRRI